MRLLPSQEGLRSICFGLSAVLGVCVSNSYGNNTVEQLTTFRKVLINLKFLVHCSILACLLLLLLYLHLHFKHLSMSVELHFAHYFTVITEVGQLCQCFLSNMFRLEFSHHQVHYTFLYIHIYVPIR